MLFKRLHLTDCIFINKFEMHKLRLHVYIDYKAKSVVNIIQYNVCVKYKVDKTYY